MPPRPRSCSTWKSPSAEPVRSPMDARSPSRTWARVSSPAEDADQRGSWSRSAFSEGRTPRSASRAGLRIFILVYGNRKSSAKGKALGREIGGRSARSGPWKPSDRARPGSHRPHGSHQSYPRIPAKARRTTLYRNGNRRYRGSIGAGSRRIVPDRRRAAAARSASTRRCAGERVRTAIPSGRVTAPHNCGGG